VKAFVQALPRAAQTGLANLKEKEKEIQPGLAKERE